MRCPACSSDVGDGRRFCPSCGTPLGVTVGAAAERAGAAGSGRRSDTWSGDGATAPAGNAGNAGDAGDAGDAATRQARPEGGAPQDAAAYPDEPVYPPTVDLATPATGLGDPPVTGDDAGPTQVLAVDAGTRSRQPWTDRARPAWFAVRRRAGALDARFRAAPADVRLASLGAALTLLAFLAFPYAVGTGTAVALGGRLWWRPLAACATVALLATGRADERRVPDRLLVALAIAAAGATEAGLVGLVSGDSRGARLGYYGMLAGLVMVLFAAYRAARRAGPAR